MPRKLALTWYSAARAEARDHPGRRNSLTIPPHRREDRGKENTAGHEGAHQQLLKQCGQRRGCFDTKLIPSFWRSDYGNNGLRGIAASSGTSRWKKEKSGPGASQRGYLFSKKRFLSLSDHLTEDTRTQIRMDRWVLAGRGPLSRPGLLSCVYLSCST